MKILYVYDVIARRGGMERVIVDKMNSFSKIEDMNVYLLTTNQGCHPIPFELTPEVHYEDLGVQNIHGTDRSRGKLIHHVHEDAFRKGIIRHPAVGFIIV